MNARGFAEGLAGIPFELWAVLFLYMHLILGFEGTLESAALST
jgi:hypothetical protein